MRELLHERQLKLELTDAAKIAIARQGYDPVFGARPLKRTLQRQLQNPLAAAILAGRFVAGDTIVCDVDGEALTFAKSNDAAAATVH